MSYPCTECEKMFDNPQALGGHMRSHVYKRPKPTGEPAEVPGGTSGIAEADQAALEPMEFNVSVVSTSSSAVSSCSLAAHVPVPPPLPPPTPLDLTCQTCGQKFTTSQGLGGHRSGTCGQQARDAGINKAARKKRRLEELEEQGTEGKEGSKAGKGSRAGGQGSK